MAACALRRAFAANVVPVSSGSSSPSSAAESALMPNGAISSRISRQLAGVMGCNDQATVDLAMYRSGKRIVHITAIFCRSTSFATPLRASARRVSNCSSLNGSFSAVPCTSTIRPSPVITKFASVSASESSA